MRFRWIPLALTLALVSGGTSTPSTAAAVAGGRKCELKPKLLKKLNKDGWSCQDQPYFKDITAWTAFVVLFYKANSAGSIAIAKHEGGYYLVLYTGFPRKGEFLVRAQEDPLMFKFQDGSEMKLLLTDDTRSKRLGRKKQQFCGFYPITREQLESEGQKLLAEATQFFIAAEDEKLHRRAEETEEGRDFFRWPVKVDRGRFPHIASCALEFE